jgi:ABC-2 type transport system permease protein
VVTPIQPWELLIGKLLPYVFICFAQVGVAMTIGVFWFGVPIRGSLLLLLGLSSVFLVSVLGLGLLISTISRTQTQAMQTCFFVLLPSLLLSGFMFPLEAMPRLIAALGYALPLTYFIQILRGIMLKGIGLAELWQQAAILTAFSLGVFLLSVARFRKTLE